MRERSAKILRKLTKTLTNGFYRDGKLVYDPSSRSQIVDQKSPKGRYRYLKKLFREAKAKGHQAAFMQAARNNIEQLK